MECKRMFWGIILKPDKRYEQTVEEAFHVSMACLEPSGYDGKITSVYAEVEGDEFIICNVGHSSNLNQTLDLTFDKGEKICLRTEGGSTVHLTGYLVPSESDEYFDSDEESDEDEAEPSAWDKRVMNGEAKKSPLDKLLAESRKKSPKNKSKQTQGQKRKLAEEAEVPEKSKQKVNAESDDESDEDTNNDDLLDSYAVEDDDDDDVDLEEEEDLEDEDSEEEHDESMMSVGEEEEDSEDEGKVMPEKSPKKKLAKKSNDKQTPAKQAKTPEQQKTPGKQQKKTPAKDRKQQVTPSTTEKKKTGNENGSKAGDDKQTPGKNKQKKKVASPTTKTNGDTPAATGKTPKKTLKGGLMVEDVKAGNGPEAKRGKMVGMYYEGKLKSNNKVFDSVLSGKPFKFRLGQGEVIKGWDVGVEGIKVGGKRKLVIPASMAYGSEGASPDIPPNATLVFEIECKYVK